MTAPTSLAPTNRSTFWLFVILGLVLVILTIASLAVGTRILSPFDLLKAAGSEQETIEMLVLAEIRLPRTLLALMIGGILGLSGASLQGLLRNPLAEPGLIGVSASASLGAVIAIYTGLTTLMPLALPLSALAGAFCAVFLLHALTGRTGDILTLILAGVALTSMAGALTSLILNLSDNPFAALEIIFWMLGSLANRSMVHVGLAAPFILAGGLMLFMTMRAMDALSLGEDVAHSLGINLSRTRWLATFGTAAGVGAATAVAGAIGFVGLIIPHLLRPLVGNRPSLLLPASMLGGAAFLLAADIGIRVFVPTKDLKLGVITALLGAPFFLWLLIKTRRQAQ